MLDSIQKYAILIVSLFLAEVFIFLLLTEFAAGINDGLLYMLNNFLKVQVEIFWSLLFSCTLRAMYYPFHIIPFIWLVSNVSKECRPLKIAIINASLALFIPCVYAFASVTIELIIEAWGLILIIAAVAFLSPFILNTIPYYKKLIANLKGAAPSVAVESQEEEIVYELGVGEKKITLFIVLKYLLFTLSLFVVGALAFTALAMCFFHKQPFKLQYMWDMVLFCMQFSATKLLLYYPLQFIPLVCLMSEIVGRYRVLKLAIVNAGLYIIISLVYAALKPDTRVYFLEGFYYIFILAMFISPVLLIRVPYFKQLARSLEQPHAPHMFKRMLDFVLSIK